MSDLSRHKVSASRAPAADQVPVKVSDQVSTPDPSSVEGPTLPMICDRCESPIGVTLPFPWARFRTDCVSDWTCTCATPDPYASMSVDAWRDVVDPNGQGILTERTRGNLAQLAKWHAQGTITCGNGDTGKVHGPDEGPFYVVTLAMGGYMPESDPYVFAPDPALPAAPQVLEVLRDECERMADQDALGEPFATDPGMSSEAVLASAQAEHRATMDAWDAVISEIARDIDRACDLSEDGFFYALPGGYVLEATRRTAAELTDLGYVRGEDF